MTSEQQDALATVEYASLAVGQAQDQLTAAIRAAHREGASLRKIARASGLSQ